MTNAAIVTFFMSNIDMETVDLQRRVVRKFNKKKYPHYSIQTMLSHGHSIDLAWILNGVPGVSRAKTEVTQHFDHDVLLFLDVDAVPLNDYAIQDTIEAAANGKLIGNVQRSNHINNNEHLFVAPSVLAIGRDNFKLIECPSAIPSQRGDVCEEYTYRAETIKIPVEFYVPEKYDELPQDGKEWQLAGDLKPYGRGTTFVPQNDSDKIGMFWHQFQSMHPGQKEKFWKKCNDLLAKK